MTYTNAIEVLRTARYEALLACKNSAALHQSAAVDAHAKAASAATRFTVAAELSEVLRQLDPEHAEDYPDPTAAGAISFVDQVHALAILLTAAKMPPINGRPRVEIDVDTTAAEAQGFIDRLTAESEGWDVKWHNATSNGGHAWIKAEKRDGPVRVGIDLWFMPEPVAEAADEDTAVEA